MSSLTIIEPNWMGHNMLYAAWTTTQAMDMGYDVSLATRSTFLSHPFYRELTREHKGTLNPRVLTDASSQPQPGFAGYKFHYHKMFSKYMNRLEDNEVPEGVFVPYLDYCTHATGLMGSPFGDVPWAGIVINPDFHLRASGIVAPKSSSQRIKEILFFKMLRNESLKIVLTLDELLIGYLRKAVPTLASKVRYIPEPARLGTLPDKHIARDRLGIPHELKVALVYGVVDYTKGLDALLTALTSNNIAQDLAVLVAGPQTLETKKFLRSPEAQRLRASGRLYEQDAFLYGEIESAVFAASDIVWVGYRDQYISSGVLIQAGMAGLPVVACNEGLIGYLTRSKKLGISMDIRDTNAIVESLSSLTQDSTLTAEYASNGVSYSSSHTVENFKESLGKVLMEYFPLAESSRGAN